MLKFRPHARQLAMIADEDAEFCRRLGEHGVTLLQKSANAKTGMSVNILTHCNAGWLAFVDYGSATAPIYAAHDRGIKVHVWVDETRPRNQGATIDCLGTGTAWRCPFRDRRQCGRPFDAAWSGGSGHHRNRPHHLHRRRGQQDWHLSQGAGGEGQ